MIEVYTDGACSKKIGGWAAIIIESGSTREISGKCEQATTNQRMELQAAIEALSSIKEASQITLYSDSAYLVNCFRQSWYVKWLANDWKTREEKVVLNQDLWKKLLELNNKHQIEFMLVKGHADNILNNRCDELARTASSKKEI